MSIWGSFGRLYNRYYNHILLGILLFTVVYGESWNGKGVVVCMKFIIVRMFVAVLLLVARDGCLGLLLSTVAVDKLSDT